MQQLRRGAGPRSRSPQPCLLLLLWANGGGGASPAAAAQELTVLLAGFVQPVWKAFKIEDVPVESFKISLD